MNNKKLPIRSIFLEAVSLPYKHYRMLLKIGLPLIILGVLSILFTYFFSDSAGSLAFGTLLFVCASTAFYFFLVIAVVGCHRIFLMTPTLVEDTKILNLTDNVLKYVGWWILISVAAALPLLLVMMLVMGFISDGFVENGGMSVILFGLISIPILYLASRWSMVLPSSAIDIHGKNLTWSWGLSRGNGWRLTLLIGILPIGLDILFDLLPTFDSFIWTLFTGAIWLVVGVIEVGLLSLSYAFLVSEEKGQVALT